MEKLKRNSYVMYFNVSDAALDLLSDKEYKEFGMMIHEYVFFGIEPETDNMTIKMLLKLYRPALDESLASYDKRATGNGGGRKKKHKEPQETIENHSKPQETIDNNMDTTSNPNNNVNDNVNVNDNEIVPECNNTRKQKEYDGTMTVDTSTSTNNQAHNVEKEKEQYDVNILPVTEGTTKKSKEYYIKCFEEGCGKGLEPTVDQITGFVVKNNVSFEKDDFKVEVYQGYKVGDKYQATMKNLALSSLKKLRPMKVKVEEGGYGYSFSSDTKSVQEFMKMYVESDKHQDLNIIVV